MSEFSSRMKPSHIPSKHAMRYSAAYPTGRELASSPGTDAPEKLRFEGKVAKGDGEAARKGPRAERIDDGRMYECALPEYLAADLAAYKEGRESGSSLLDCLWGELYGSINIAEINDNAITHAQAQYLRDKYLFGKA